MSSNKESKFTCEWTIFNLYLFGGVHENELISPKFSVPSLDNSEWYLKLQLTRDFHLLGVVRKSTTKCFLCRTDSGPENIEIYYSISETFNSKSSVNHQSFQKNSSSDIPFIVTDFDQLCRNGDQGLPTDVEITCRLWQLDNDDFFPAQDDPARPYPVFCSTCTVIPCEERNFYFPINNFSTLSNGFTARVLVESAGDSNAQFIFELSKLSFNTLGNVFQLNILKPDLQHPTALVIKYEIQLVDALEKKHSLVSGQFIFESGGHQATFLVPTSMLEKKNRYIPGDVMILSCEFVVSDNKAFSFTASTRYDSSDITQATSPVCGRAVWKATCFRDGPVCGWVVYLDHVYNEHIFLCRLLALLLIVFSLAIPYFFPDYSL